MRNKRIGWLIAAALWAGIVSPSYGESSESDRARMAGPSHFEAVDTLSAAPAAASPASPAVVLNPVQLKGLDLSPTKRPWAAALKVVGMNLGVWAIDRYAIKSWWAYIDLNSIKKNFRTGLIWDNDDYVTNCIAHPLHGSAYYNCARSSGLSFWESVPFALGGSLMWETMMETEAPSANDLFFTTLGGIYIGETFHRLSSRILDSRARGLERAAREFLGFVLNPAGGLGRLFSGAMFRSQGLSGKAQDPFETTLMFGRTETATPWGIFQSEGAPLLAVTFRSGDPFSSTENPGAFDFFVHRSRFIIGATFRTTQSGYGYLAGQRLGDDHILGVFANYDFRITEAVSMAGPSITGGLVSHFRLGKKAELRTAVQLGAMLLGTCDDPYLQTPQSLDREYDFGSGAVAKAEATMSLGRLGTFQAVVSHHLMAVVEGSSGVNQATFFEASYDVPVYKSWSVGFEYVSTQRDSDYRDVPDVKASYSDLRLISSFRF